MASKLSAIEDFDRPNNMSELTEKKKRRGLSKNWKVMLDALTENVRVCLILTN